MITATGFAKGALRKSAPGTISAMPRIAGLATAISLAMIGTAK